MARLKKLEKSQAPGRSQEITEGWNPRKCC